MTTVNAGIQHTNGTRRAFYVEGYDKLVEYSVVGIGRKAAGDSGFYEFWFLVDGHDDGKENLIVSVLCSVVEGCLHGYRPQTLFDKHYAAINVSQFWRVREGDPEEEEHLNEQQLSRVFGHITCHCDSCAALPKARRFSTGVSLISKDAV